MTKYQNQTLVIITQSLKYKRNNRKLGLYVYILFSLHDLNYNLGPMSLKECNGTILNCLKRNSGLGSPISPSGHQGVPISSSLGSLICPLHHQKTPKLMFHCFIRGPNFPFSSSGHLAPHSFPVALLRVSNFHIASSKRAKGPKFFIAPSRAPNFLIVSSK